MFSCDLNAKKITNKTFKSGFDKKMGHLPTIAIVKSAINANFRFLFDCDLEDNSSSVFSSFIGISVAGHLFSAFSRLSYKKKQQHYHKTHSNEQMNTTSKQITNKTNEIGRVIIVS